MSALGTDLVAVACIVGGAAVGGGTTMAMVRGHHPADARVACAAATVNAHPRVVVSMDGGKGTVVVSPRVRVHASHNCAAFVVDVDRVNADVRVNMDEVRARIEEAQVRMQEARVRVQEAQQRVQEAQQRAQEAQGRAEEARARTEARNAEIQARIQKRLQERMDRLNKKLAKLDAGKGR